MVDLIDVEADLLQTVHEFFDHRTASRQALVVVARLVQGIGGIGRRDAAVLVTFEEHELGFDTGVDGPATLRGARQLAFHDVAGVVRPGLAVDRAVADDTRISRLPRHQAKGIQIPDRHEVVVVWPLTEPPGGEAGKTGAVGQDHIEMFGRYGLRFRHAMNVDELCQDEFDVVVLQEGLRFCGCHAVSLPELISAR